LLCDAVLQEKDVSGYSAPVADMRFVLSEIVGLEGLSRLEGFEAASPETIDAVLEEAAKLAAEVLAPLNAVGDEQASVLENGVVHTPQGFKEAYQALVKGGWNGLPFPPEYGGQGLPWVVALVIAEMWGSANLAFSLCPVLTQGAAEMLLAHGSAVLRQRYLAKLVSGEWTATMNLTEPQAGSDVGAITTRAVPEGDHYRITGTKIFITFGEHDLADNIIHMVLARIPDAPVGSKGISCFLVPKRMVHGDGALGEANDLRCVSLEHKLGIHASPTAVMSFGDEGGAIGYLIGEENRGLACMFTMMNSERLLIGLQGVSLAERAYQQALAYAMERRQGRPLDRPAEGAVPIIEHPDVRRMLMVMKASTEAMRGMAYETAAAIDHARRHPDADVRAERLAFVELMTPVIKAWCSDLGIELTSLGIQVHGGMGYIEETGAAQLFRDSRIAPIYEGTNGIQAFDLVMRKLPREEGRAIHKIINELNALDGELAGANVEDLQVLKLALADAATGFAEATAWLLKKQAQDSAAAAAGATSYLRLFGLTAGGSVLARSALAAQRRLMDGDGDEAFLRAKIVTARFYAEHVLPQAAALLKPVTAGTAALAALDADAGV
jgi:alkylation response protein AidB-like acyl-CoA dehydrogenase